MSEVVANQNINNNPNYIEEDEIDLRELWQTILKGKKIIAIVTIVVVALTFVYALKQPNVYKSQSVLIPTNSQSGLKSLTSKYNSYISMFALS